MPMLDKTGQKSIIIVMLVNPELRKKAQRLVRENTEVSLVNVAPEHPSDEEIQEFLKEIKPYQYAAHARVIDPLIERVVAIPLTLKDGRSHNFGNLRAEAQFAFWGHILHLENSGNEAFIEAAEYTSMIGKLNGTYTDLAMQLHAGAGSAASTMMNLLEDMPGIIEFHEPSADLSTKELSRIAQNSGRLAWRMAGMTSDQMVAIREASPLTDEIPEDATIDIADKMKCFKLIHNPDGTIHSIDFEDLENLPISAGFEYRDFDPISEATSLKDIDFHNIGAVGCPITLLQGRMTQLWQWQLQAVVDNRLWAK